MTTLFFDDIIAFKEMMYQQRSAETEKEMKRKKRRYSPYDWGYTA